MTRTIFTKVRTDEAERQAIRELAESEGLSVSDLIRTRLDLSPLQRPRRKGGDGAATLDAIAAHLRSKGS